VRSLALLALASVTLGGCALKGDVRRVEEQLVEFRAETARSDSLRAVLLDEVLDLQQQFLDSLAYLQRRLIAFQGDVRTDMTEVQRQLVAIQELTGQSQQRISELRAQMNARAAAGFVAAEGQAPGDSAAPAGDVGAQEMFDVSLEQLRRGSPGTARAGFQQFLREYPRHPLAGDAWFFLGESWEASDGDSAAVAYDQVVEQFPDSRRAPTALYRLGLLAERAGDRRAAEVYYSRVIAGYPRSEEARLARSKLENPEG
jgi:tol-pal system protein YbgF